MRYIIITIVTIAIFGSGIVAGLLVAMKLDDTYGATAISPYPTIFEYPTGYQVLEELNKYREKNNLPPFVLWDVLCNNISSRAIQYRETNSHDGFKEFLNKNMPRGLKVTEILVSGNTAKEMVDKWASSPGHDLAIKSNSRACIYSSRGVAVGLLAN